MQSLELYYCLKVKKSVMKKVLFIAFVALVGLGSVSCKKKKAKKNLIGSFQREFVDRIYSDSTSQLLLRSTTFTFSDGDVIVGGEYGSNFHYSLQDTDVQDYDFELVFADLDYSKWLPSNYVNTSTGIENTVVPNTGILSQTKFFVKTSPENLFFVIKYPSSTDTQVLTRY